MGSFSVPKGRVFIVGAGLAGLSSAVFLTGKGLAVEVFEAAGQAGGRCRSFHDATLGCRIDNGNHLLLSGNTAVAEYLRQIGAGDSLAGPRNASFPFYDVRTGSHWTVRPNRGWVPWWVFSKSRRVPGTRAGEYFRAAGLARGKGQNTVAEILDRGGDLYGKFWEPFALAVLNTAPEEAAATLLWPVIRETFGRGEAAYRPRVAREGLSESFVEPALRHLAARSGEVTFGRRLRALEFSDGRVATLDFGDVKTEVRHEDAVILALPPSVCQSLVRGLCVPDDFRPIVNVHFRVGGHADVSLITGLIGGTAQWVFVRGEIVSVTVSAARDLVEEEPERIAVRAWADVSRLLGSEGDPLPSYRVIKEKRATFAQTPEQAARRPGARTRWENLFLAGDWTATGLPATIEGAIRSGAAAAELAADGCDQA